MIWPGYCCSTVFCHIITFCCLRTNDYDIAIAHDNDDDDRNSIMGAATGAILDSNPGIFFYQGLNGSTVYNTHCYADGSG